MLNKLSAFLREYDMIAPGESDICAVSGGADSMALLWGMYLLRERMGFFLSAAHFNHHLRGAESDADEAFVAEFCEKYDIPLHRGGARVTPGEKGLEAAARDARYAFFATLPGRIATAHTADDNAETVLLHLVRGTGLKGLGAIAPVNGSILRPMLSITRQEVLDFLAEWSIPHREDSSNDTDEFLRNRLRHHVMPLLKAENPRLAENLSATALRLRLDEAALSELSQVEMDVEALKALSPALRSRALERFLKESGVREPEAAHIRQAEALVFSGNPSARAVFPGGVTIGRVYGRLEKLETAVPLPPQVLPCPGSVYFPDLGLRVTAEPCQISELTTNSFTIRPEGDMILRGRLPGDEMRLSGGTKSLKKLFVDRKIPASRRDRIPVLADSAGILGVWGIGANLDRTGSAVRIQFLQEHQREAENR